MRYIRYVGKPPQELIEEANETTRLLEESESEDERKDIIKRKRKVYRKFHDWLLNLSYGKCWFSDTDSYFQHFDVEHFRPKMQCKDGFGNKREGYWWLAFDWENLRICGNVGNRKKGSFFPLAEGSHPATATSRDHSEEVPMLLDPINEYDASIVDFNQFGEIVPSIGTSEFDEERLRVSVERYKLDFERLEEGRRLVWEECESLINLCQNQLKKYSKTKKPIYRDRATGTMARISGLVNYKKKQLSSVVVSCLLASELGWARRIATTEPQDD